MQLFQGLNFSNIKGDAFGGITAGIVALPLALAFGIQAFGSIHDPQAVMIGAMAGLTGAIMLGFFASLFGGTPSQVSGPTGPMTVIISTIAGMGYEKLGGLEPTLTFIMISVIIGGIFQILFGIIKLGQYVRYIPYPVLSGFMSGIGVIIILMQLFPLAGLKSPGSILQIIGNSGELFQHANFIALGWGVLTLILIYVFPLLTKKVPSTLLALVVVSILSAITGFDTQLTIGKIPSGFPTLKLGWLEHINWEMINMALIPGLTLAGLGAIDTLLTSVVADNITKTRHNSNKELLGQGIGNIISGIFGGIPGAGATMRTVINVKAGGRSQLSGMIHSLFLLAVLLGLGSLVSYIPLSVLAGVLISVGIGIIDYKGIKDIPYIPRADAVVLVTVLLLTVFVDLLQAVGIGMVIASVLFMKRAGDLVDSGTSLKNIDAFDKEIPWEDEKEITPEILQSVYIQRLDGPIFFGSVTRFSDVMSTIPDHAKIVIIRMRRVPFMDQSGLYAMENAVNDLKNKGIIVLMTIIQPQPLYMMEKINLIPGLVPKEYTFETFEECAQWLKVNINKLLNGSKS